MHSLIAGILIIFYGTDGNVDLPKTLVVNALIVGGIVLLVAVVRSVATRANRTKAAQTHQRLGFEPSADGTGRAERSTTSPEDF